MVNFDSANPRFTVPREAIVPAGVPKSFITDLTKIINIHSVDGYTNTPDFMLAEFIGQFINQLAAMLEQRHQHRFGKPESVDAPAGVSSEQQIERSQRNDLSKSSQFIITESTHAPIYRVTRLNGLRIIQYFDAHVDDILLITSRITGLNPHFWRVKAVHSHRLDLQRCEEFPD